MALERPQSFHVCGEMNDCTLHMAVENQAMCRTSRKSVQLLYRWWGVKMWLKKAVEEKKRQWRPYTVIVNELSIQICLRVLCGAWACWELCWSSRQSTVVCAGFAWFGFFWFWQGRSRLYSSGSLAVCSLPCQPGLGWVLGTACRQEWF